MLPLPDDVLRRLLTQQMPADMGQVAFNFDQPTRETSAPWGGPTLNLFLYDLRENAKMRHAPDDLSESLYRPKNTDPAFRH
jgi:hypothetical protein